MSMHSLLLAAALLSGCGSAVRARSATPPRGVEQGIELYQSRQFRQAAQVLEEATKASPGDARGLVYLGLSRLELGEYASAEEAFRRALEIDGRLAQAHYGLGLALGHRNDLDGAIAELQKAVDLDDRHAYAHYHLGLAFNQKGAKDRAFLHLQRFLELEPDAPEAGRVKALLSQLG